MSTEITYEDAGVDIALGNHFVESIKPLASATKRPEVLAGLGGFGALFELPWQKYKKPVLVSGTDGVGTKLKLAFALQKHDTIGIDLVAMCVNDIIVSGAEPLFFLDYFASGKLEINTAKAVIQGIAQACQLANCALIGGETAEMPGFYQKSEYDLAGFAVGIVEKDEIIDGRKIKAGDVLLGLASSGVHANGFSLVRKILETNACDLSMPFEGSSLGEILLQPTKIYVNSILALKKVCDIHALAHITGGGLTENLPRVLPEFTKAIIDKQSWDRPAIFNWLEKSGHLSCDQMYKTFNCGIGMVVCLAQEEVETALSCLQKQGETVYQIGRIEISDAGKAFVEYQN